MQIVDCGRFGEQVLFFSRGPPRVNRGCPARPTPNARRLAKRRWPDASFAVWPKHPWQAGVRQVQVVPTVMGDPEPDWGGHFASQAGHGHTV